MGEYLCVSIRSVVLVAKMLSDRVSLTDYTPVRRMHTRAMAGDEQVDALS